MIASTAACGGVADCERACAGGAAGACVEAGRLYEFGQRGVAEPNRAFPLYDRACFLGSAGGCFNSAVLLQTGRGDETDGTE